MKEIEKLIEETIENKKIHIHLIQILGYLLL